MKSWWMITGLGISIVVGVFLLVLLPAPHTATAPTAPKASLGDLIMVDSPLPNSTISSSTVVISGRARGSWYFEGVFPIQISNASGTILGRGQAHAQSEWATNDYVPFTANIQITGRSADGTSEDAFIKLFNDNPSGDPAKQKVLRLEIVLK